MEENYITYTGVHSQKNWNGITYYGEIVEVKLNNVVKTYIYAKKEEYFLPIKGDTFARTRTEVELNVKIANS